jgi:hypothetical protein
MILPGGTTLLGPTMHPCSSLAPSSITVLNPIKHYGQQLSYFIVNWAWIKSAIILNCNKVTYLNMSWNSCRKCSSCVNNSVVSNRTVISNSNILNNDLLNSVNISSNYSSVPNLSFTSDLNFSYKCSVRSYKCVESDFRGQVIQRNNMSM